MSRFIVPLGLLEQGITPKSMGRCANSNEIRRVFAAFVARTNRQAPLPLSWNLETTSLKVSVAAIRST